DPPSLSAEERIQVVFTAAECRFSLGRYDEALQFYDVLAQRYKGRTESLYALAGCVRCLAARGRFDELKERLQELWNTLGELDTQQIQALADGPPWEAAVREKKKQAARP